MNVNGNICVCVCARAYACTYMWRAHNSRKREQCEHRLRGLNLLGVKVIFVQTVAKVRAKHK